MKSFFKNKNNIIIGLCAVVILMGIGFATFSANLKIGDTVATSSDWNVYIKSVTAGTPVGKATGSGEVVDRATAKLTASLSSPGDSVTYTIVVANDGNIDAVLDLITLSASNSDSVIKYSYAGITNDEELLAQTETSFTVTIEYDSTKTGNATAEQKQNTLTLNLDYVQKGNETIEPEAQAYSVYRFTDDTLKIGDSIEGITTSTDPSALYNSEYYLKHDINSSGLIENTYLCVKIGQEYCLKGGDPSAFSANVDIVKAVEPALISNSYVDSCTYSETMASCGSSWWLDFQANSDGSLNILDATRAYCTVYADGSSKCS